MKRQIKETTVLGKRGPQRVITYGYNTQIDGLDVIRCDGNRKQFVPIHRISGLSIDLDFPSAIKAVKFANKYLKDFDFTQSKDDLLRDGKLEKHVHDAKIREGL